MDYPISFPGLGLTLPVPRVAFSLFGRPIYWYGIIIAAGLLLALVYAMRRTQQFGVTPDDLADVVIFSVIFGIIGARLYFVIFYPESPNPYFSDPVLILRIWEGGLGIFGGILAAFLTGFIVCRIKKISTGAVFDLAALGFLIGQAVGRWGNFFNREAYGAVTSLPWRMVVDNSGTGYHPCFLYESLWCILGFILLHIYSKRRKFNGEVFLLYIMWYSFGRFFIEWLRTDSLMLGNLKISQLVAVILFILALSFLIYKRRKLAADGTGEYHPIFEETARAVDAEKGGDDGGEEPPADSGEKGPDPADDEKAGEE